MLTSSYYPLSSQPSLLRDGIRPHLEYLALALLRNVALDLASLYDLERFLEILAKQKIKPACTETAQDNSS